MAVIIKKCPHCGYTYDNYSNINRGKQYGSPIIRCPKCGGEFCDKEIKERAFGEPPEKQSIIETFFRTFCGLIIFEIAGGILVGGYYQELSKHENPSIWLLIIGSIILGICLILIIFACFNRDGIKDEEQNEYDSSLARCSNKDYIDKLQRYKYFVPPSFIKEHFQNQEREEVQNYLSVRQRAELVYPFLVQANRKQAKKVFPKGVTDVEVTIKELSSYMGIKDEDCDEKNCQKILLMYMDAYFNDLSMKQIQEKYAKTCECKNNKRNIRLFVLQSKNETSEEMLKKFAEESDNDEYTGEKVIEIIKSIYFDTNTLAKEKGKQIYPVGELQLEQILETDAKYTNKGNIKGLTGKETFRLALMEEKVFTLQYNYNQQGVIKEKQIEIANFIEKNFSDLYSNRKLIEDQTHMIYLYVVIKPEDLIRPAKKPVVSENEQNKFPKQPLEVKKGKENSQSEIVYCHKCGYKLLPGSQFCSKCGTKIP